MAIKAVEELLAKTHTNPLDIDLIICATTTPDMQFPATANIVADKVGAKNAWGYDLNAACSGFLYALTTASKIIQAQQTRLLLLVVIKCHPSLISPIGLLV
jgi:3-oxoacyl-[acyl-carrier-protein] synthase-3